MANTVGELTIELRGAVGKLQADMDKATRILSKTETSIGKIAGNINKAISLGFAGAALFGIKKLGDSLIDLVNRGEKVGSIAEGFKKLGGSSDQIIKAQDAIQGLLTKTELMQVANEGLVKQIPGFNENFALIADIGGRLANTLGTDTAGAIRQVTEALAAGKVQGLQNLGFVIDADAAYRKYAEANGLLADKLTKTQKQEAIQIEADKQLVAVRDKLAPVTDSASNAFVGFEKAMSDVVDQVSVQLNQSKSLQDAFRGLADAVKSIDWAGILTTVSNFVADIINQFRMIANYSLSKDFQQWQDTFLRGVEVVKKAVEGVSLSNPIPDITKATTQVFAEEQARNKNATPQMPLIDSKEVSKSIAEVAKLGSTIETAYIPPARKAGEVSAETLKNQQSEAKKAAEEIKKLGEKWNDTIRDLQGDVFKDGLQNAIDRIDEADFKSLVEKFREFTKQGILQGLEESVKKGAITSDQANVFASVEADRAVNEWQDKFSDKITETSKELADKQKDAFKDSIDFWENTFQNAITGVTFNLKDALEQIAVGFASQIAASAFGSIGDAIKSPKDLGSFLASQFGFGGPGGAFGSTPGKPGGGDGLSGIASTLFGSGRPEGVSGPLMNNGAFSPGLLNSIAPYIPAGLSVLQQIGGIGKNSKKTGAAVGSLAGAGIGAAVGGPVGAFAGSFVGGGIGKLIGGLFGSGPKNPETLARKKVEKFLEDTLGPKHFKVFDSKGNLKEIDNFIFGASNRFNDPNWTAGFDKLDSKAKDTFNGIGMALQKVLGITEDVGGQIGVILAENLGGSVDNAKLLVAQLGVSFEDLQNALLETAKAGDITWHEFEVGLQGLTQAFEPGIAAVGDFNGAFSNLLKSGGRGIESLKSIKDIAVEALESGMTSLDQLKQSLLDSGQFNPEDVAAVFQAIQQRGIASLQDLANVSDRVGGGIIADAESIGVQWQGVSTSIDDVVNKLGKIPDITQKELHWDVTTSIDSATAEARDGGVFGSAGIDPTAGLGNVQPFANGGIVRGPKMFKFASGVGLMGEAGPEGILPLKRINGKLGVMADLKGSGGGSIYIDARGASAGSEHKILQAMKHSESRAVRRAVTEVSNRRRRGGAFFDAMHG